MLKKLLSIFHITTAIFQTEKFIETNWDEQWTWSKDHLKKVSLWRRHRVRDHNISLTFVRVTRERNGSFGYSGNVCDGVQSEVLVINKYSNFRILTERRLLNESVVVCSDSAEIVCKPSRETSEGVNISEVFRRILRRPRWSSVGRVPLITSVLSFVTETKWLDTLP